MAKHRKQSDAARRLGTSALAAASATGALLALDGTAHAATKTPSKALMGYLPAKVTSGDTIRVRTTLETTSGTKLGGRLVYLERNNGGKWWRIGSTRTYSTGGASKVVKNDHTASYRWHFYGDDHTASSTSPSKSVTATASLATKILKDTAAQAGKPYVYGANGPDSFDCSGLTQYAHKLAGKSIPRTSGEQYAASHKVSQSSKKPGDLLFFHGSGGVYHAAVYAGNGEMWDAPESGDVVRKHAIWSSSYYVGRFW